MRLSAIEQISHALVGAGAYVEAGERYLRFSEDTPYEVWEEVVRRLRFVNSNVQWWLGDALRFGEHRYGQMYTQALEETDYTYGALSNMAYVAAHVEVSSRDENLSWSHHRAVAPLPEERQRELLAKAKEERLSVRDVREIASEEEVGAFGVVEKVPTITCPRCGGDGEIPVA